MSHGPAAWPGAHCHGMARIVTLRPGAARGVKPVCSRAHRSAADERARQRPKPKAAVDGAIRKSAMAQASACAPSAPLSCNASKEVAESCDARDSCGCESCICTRSNAGNAEKRAATTLWDNEDEDEDMRMRTEVQASMKPHTKCEGARELMPQCSAAQRSAAAAEPRQAGTTAAESVNVRAAEGKLPVALRYRGMRALGPVWHRTADATNVS